LKRLSLTWAILRLIWESKGYSMKELPDLLKARWPGREGFAFASIQRKSQRGRKAPADVAAFVMDAKTLPVRKGHEKPAEVVQLGLSALRGQPTPSKQPPELALSQLAHFPTNALALKLADALVGQAGPSPGTGSTFGKLARHMARLVAKRIGCGKLDSLQATCILIDVKLDGLSAKIDKSTAEILRAVRGSGGLGGGLVGGLLVCAAVVLMNCQHVVTSAASAPQVPPAHELATVTPQPLPVVIVATAGQGLAPIMLELSALLGAVAGQMGEKVPPEQYVPNLLLPGQKPPPCDAGLAERAVGGGCWVGTDMKPPCGRLFRNDNTCYRPVAATPLKPVMVVPQAPDQEKH